ncbi:MAG: hypothetical protein P1Q69_07230 [Candidatus Thorarchaeota archaeon]|nr:hypothetical protein [Candidatus Thorarchaeota archaeon]
MLSFLTMCPHCEHVSYPSDCEQTEAKAEEDLVYAPETCETYVKLAEKMIDENGHPYHIASLYHRGACCRKLQGEDSAALFRMANKYYLIAKDNGMESGEDIKEVNIDELIEKTLV